jgi:hypothetical protein
MHALQKMVEREVFGIRDDNFAIEQKMPLGKRKRFCHDFGKVAGKVLTGF